MPNQSAKARQALVEGGPDPEQLRQLIYAIEAQQGDHGYSQNSAALLIGSGGSVLASVVVSPKISGKYRVIGTCTFTNSAAASHSLQLAIQTGIGSASVISTVYTQPTNVGLISNVTYGAECVVQFELSAGLAVSTPGGSGVIQLQGIADASAAISTAINGATLTVQEIL
jgi:hypothetical protein